MEHEEQEQEGGEEELKKIKPSSSPFTPSSILPSKESEEGREFKPSSSVFSLLLGDLNPGQAFEKWVALVRKRSGRFRNSGFPRRNSTMFESMPSGFFPSLIHHEQRSERMEARDLVIEEFDNSSITSTSTNTSSQEMNLWDRLGNAARLDIDSVNFSWDTLQSLHHTEHTASTDQSEDETGKALEVTVNSGGVVFFALFSTAASDDVAPKESAAVIKFSSSRMATQSERLGYEFAKWLEVPTPQARVIHNSSPEWQQIKEAVEKARKTADSDRDVAGEMTCSELLEALELSRCLLLMSYVHGSPLLESSKAFDSRETVGPTASSLGRVLMLDLLLRNEDRLPCRQLGWRGNPSNLMISDISLPNIIPKIPTNKLKNHLLNSVLCKDKRSNSAHGRLDSHGPESKEELDERHFHDSTIVAIDSGVPRRPPAGKRAKDHERYPKIVELILNNSDFSSNILYEISGGKLGFPSDDDGDVAAAAADHVISDADVATVAVHEFRCGFRSALRDVQGFHLFLLALYQKLEGLLRVFSSIIEKSSVENEGTGSNNNISECGFGSPVMYTDTDAHRGNSNSPVGRDNWSGNRCFKGSGEREGSKGLRLTMKLRDFHKLSKVDGELIREIEQWNERVKTEVIKFCQENNFNTGFFDGNDSNLVVDAYELKVRLEHILERIGLITDAANTERATPVTRNLYIGGALAARSVYTLQHLGITHILCLCSNEIGQSDSQFPDLFTYKNFSISDDEDADISNLFDEALDFIDYVEKSGGKVLVHCFEGKSRSATVVLAYLMLRKGCTLCDAWSTLKKVHRRAQPNDGFARVLLALDKKIHGKPSMDWQHRRPEMKVCPICGKSVGLSTSSLKLHLQKAHKRLSSGSVDSAMTIEIQKAVESLRLGRAGSVSPTGQTLSHQSFR